MKDRLSIITYGASKAALKQALNGLGVLKGANCVVEFTEAIPGGTRVRFGWTGNDGTHQTTSIYVMDGQDGRDGLGIASVHVDVNGHLIITYTDGSSSDAGKIEVFSAVDSVNGKTGDVELVLSDVVTVGSGLTYDPVTNTLSVSQQDVQTTVEDVLDEELGGRIEDELPNNLASDSDIDDLFN